MVSKEALIKAVAVLIIASFILELFVIILFSGPSSDDSGATATALASVNPADLTAGLPGASGTTATTLFVGTGSAKGVIAGFDAQSVLQCPTEVTHGGDVAARVGKVPFVTNARDYGSGLIGFSAPANFTTNEFVALSAQVQAAGAPDCPETNSSVYRLARVTFTDTAVQLTDAKGAKQGLSTRAILAFYSTLGRAALALSPVTATVNQTVLIAVQAQTHNGALVAAQGDDVNLVVVPVDASSTNDAPTATPAASVSPSASTNSTS